MAKIRGIKPETWSDESFVELSFAARLLFIGMWNFACDNGHLEDRSKQLKMRIFPADDVNAAELLRELESAGRITRGDGYLSIPTLTEHQRIDRRFFTTCDKPGCEKPTPRNANPERESRRAHDEHTTSARRAHDVGTSSARGDGDGDGDGDLMVMGKKASPRKRATQLPEDFRPGDKHIALAADLGVDLRREWPKFTDHHRAKGSTFKDWSAALNNWIRKAAEYGGATVHQFRPAVGDDGQPVLPPLPLDDKR